MESEKKMLSKLKGAGIVEPKMWCGRADQMEPISRTRPNRHSGSIRKQETETRGCKVPSDS